MTHYLLRMNYPLFSYGWWWCETLAHLTTPAMAAHVNRCFNGSYLQLCCVFWARFWLGDFFYQAVFLPMKIAQVGAGGLEHERRKSVSPAPAKVVTQYGSDGFDPRRVWTWRKQHRYRHWYRWIFSIVGLDCQWWPWWWTSQTSLGVWVVFENSGIFIKGHFLDENPHVFNNSTLVGGLVAIFYFRICWVSIIITIDELHHFSEGWPNHQPVYYEPEQLADQWKT